MQKSQKMVGFEGPYRLLYCSGKGDKAGATLRLLFCFFTLQKGADSTDRSGRTPLSDARSLSQEAICKILEAKGGIDPVGLDSQLPCYEVNHTEVNMDEAALIGEGSYVEIYLVRWRGTEVAAKTIRSSIASNPKVKNFFMKELALWQNLCHPNIVQFLGVLKHPDRLIFLTEYLCNGSLHDILKRKGRLYLQTTLSFALDIARGMNYLHQHKPHPIIHQHLTPSKIAQENDASGYKMTGQTSSYRYMAPEVYRRESYGMSIDIFSFALIVHDVSFRNLRLKLLKACWHQNPDCRPTFQEIILQLEEIQAAFQDKMKMGNCSGACVIS
ncbi:hypothetical protein C1H46_016755 [Malus baccata]|uniref:Protein kinase domain-containing protein n=1 Tax=Malus baccata TaxID=106549 RepID=A0A540MFV9_MALBA|nr:hypothetical protein C1H46_016755 [Malus baccata]